jgi:hypothetical protein
MTSVTAGTIFDRTRTPLTVWFTACWSFATAKDVVSALSLQKALEIGSQQTAWAMLAGCGRCWCGGGGRDSASPHPFVTSHVEPGAKVITDAWIRYHGLEGLGYVHERRSQRAARARGDDPGELLPAVHQVASLARRWLLSTHQGSVDEARLQSYLDEFTFRFNRRRSRSRGLVFYRVLELAVGHDPVRYHNIVAGKWPRKIPPTPPAARGHPPSLDGPPAERPWRAASLDRSGKWRPPTGITRPEGRM